MSMSGECRADWSQVCSNVVPVWLETSSKCYVKRVLWIRGHIKRLVSQKILENRTAYPTMPVWNTIKPRVKLSVKSDGINHVTGEFDDSTIGFLARVYYVLPVWHLPGILNVIFVFTLAIYISDGKSLGVIYRVWHSGFWLTKRISFDEFPHGYSNERLHNKYNTRLLNRPFFPLYTHTRLLREPQIKGRVCASFGRFGPLALHFEIDQRVRSKFHGPLEVYETWNV